MSVASHITDGVYNAIQELRAEPGDMVTIAGREYHGCSATPKEWVWVVAVRGDWVMATRPKPHVLEYLFGALTLLDALEQAVAYRRKMDGR